MFLKVLIVAVLAVGVFAEYEITEEQRNQFKQMVTDTCKKNGAEDKAEQVENSVKNFVDCVKTIINIDTVKKEIEEAKPNGALDEVFKKYCAKSPQLKTCIKSLADGVSPCLDSKIRDHLDTGKNASDQLIDFVCYKDGDRIALFIAEGGPECFKDKSSDIRQCLNTAKQSIASVDDFKKLSNDEQCGKLDELTSCVVKALETCDTPTPANMAESLFRYIRNGTSCKKN